MAHDLHDDGFHEIQLSGKQLVFLFMATTVVSIVIFLFGVLVGRGTPVGAATDVGTPDVAGEGAPFEAGLDEPPAVPQSNEPTAEQGLSYSGRLQGAEPPAERVAPAPAPTPAPVAESRAPEPVRESPPAPEPAAPAPTKAAAPAKAEPTPAPAKAEATPAASGDRAFAVQVTALTNRADAEAIAQRLQGKGYRAYVVAPDSGGRVMYKVRVGMNMSRPEAEQMMVRLKSEEKLQPWITR